MLDQELVYQVMAIVFSKLQRGAAPAIHGVYLCKILASQYGTNNIVETISGSYNVYSSEGLPD